MGLQARDNWIDQADAATSADLLQANKPAFPPISPTPLDDIITGAWRSFTYLQKLRNDASNNGNRDLACAEHYAFARAMTCAGGVFLAITTIDLAVLYQYVKLSAEGADELLSELLMTKVDKIMQFVGYLLSLGKGRTTPASGDQLKAAADGAAEGLKLHYWTSTNYRDLGAAVADAILGQDD